MSIEPREKNKFLKYLFKIVFKPRLKNIQLSSSLHDSSKFNKKTVCGMEYDAHYEELSQILCIIETNS